MDRRREEVDEGVVVHLHHRRGDRHRVVVLHPGDDPEDSAECAASAEARVLHPSEFEGRSGETSRAHEESGPPLRALKRHARGRWRFYRRNNDNNNNNNNIN